MNEIHCYDYVNRPYERVAEALVYDAVGIFERATQSAAHRAQSLVSSLKVSIAGLDVGKNIVVRVRKVERHADAPGHMADRATRLDLEWHAETNRSLFPSMRASLTVYPLSPDETQIELRGTYEPPGGVFGSIADRLVGHRVAEASVHRFVGEIASRLSTELV
jgi:hypothetical protein